MLAWNDPYAYNAGSAPTGVPPNDGRAYLWDGTQWVLDPQYTAATQPALPESTSTNWPDVNDRGGVAGWTTAPALDTPATAATTGGGGGGAGIGASSVVAPATTGTPFDWASKPAYREIPEYQAAAWETPTPFNYGAAPTRESIYSNLQSDPGYQFRLQQGLGAMQNAAISKGIARTGGTMKGLIDYAGNFASQEGANAFDQALRGYQTGLEGAKTAWDTNYGAMRDRNLGMQTNAQDLYKSKLASAETASKNAWDYWKYMADRSNDWDMMKYKVGTSMM